MDIKRRKTRQIKLGKLKIGSENPVYIQSMPKLNIKDNEIYSRLHNMIESGCDVIRIAVRDKDVAGNIGKVKEKFDVPFIADIHFDYRLALIAIKEGVDGIRLNPCNIYREDEIIKVVELLKNNNLPVRVGVNSGSMDKLESLLSQNWAKRLSQYDKQENYTKKENCEVETMVKLTLDYIDFLESMDFYDIMISIKSENVYDTIEANKRIADLCDYPLHLGVTATGLSELAIVKSSVGIGSLLANGFGDIIRVSLTDNPLNEIKIAKKILSSLNIRRFGVEIISCPTCGRSLSDVKKLAGELEKRLKDKRIDKNLKIAIMGCEVNGPGEAKHADIGIAGGKNSFLLFRKGKKNQKIPLDKAINILMKNIEDWDINSNCQVY